VVLTVTANVSGLTITIEKVYLDEDELTKGSGDDYTVSDNKITIAKAKLAELVTADETYDIVIEVTGYDNVKAKLEVVNTSD